MGKIELKIEIDAELLAKALEAGLSVGRIAEQGLERALADIGPSFGLSDEQKAMYWAKENTEAINAQRDRINAYGVFGEDLRTW